MLRLSSEYTRKQRGLYKWYGDSWTFWASAEKRFVPIYRGGTLQKRSSPVSERNAAWVHCTFKQWSSCIPYASWCWEWDQKNDNGYDFEIRSDILKRLIVIYAKFTRYKIIYYFYKFRYNLLNFNKLQHFSFTIRKNDIHPTINKTPNIINTIYFFFIQLLLHTTLINNTSIILLSVFFQYFLFF